MILSWLDVVLSYPLSLCLKAKVTCCISHLDSIPDLVHRIPDPLLVIRLHWDVLPSPVKLGWVANLTTHHHSRILENFFWHERSGLHLDWSYICENSQHTKSQPPTLLRSYLSTEGNLLLKVVFPLPTVPPPSQNQLGLKDTNVDLNNETQKTLLLVFVSKVQIWSCWSLVIFKLRLGACIPRSVCLCLSVGLSVGLSVHPKNYKNYKTAQILSTHYIIKISKSDFLTPLQ